MECVRCMNVISSYRFNDKKVDATGAKGSHDATSLTADDEIIRRDRVS